MIFTAAGLPEPVAEYRFALPNHRWAFDFAWLDYLVAFEREGGARGKVVASRHTSLDGFAADCWKYSEAALRGWCIIRATPKMIKSGLALVLVERALEARGWKKER